MRDISVLCDARGSGKTKTLMDMSTLTKKNITGILTPNRSGRRHLYSISSKTWYPLEVEKNEGKEKTVVVGRYLFLENAFTHAYSSFKDQWDINTELVIIDELGLLELRAKGFYSLVMDLLEKKPFSLVPLLLVIREHKLEEMIAFFKLNISEIYNLQSLEKSGIW